MMTKRHLFAAAIVCLLIGGCSSSTQPPPGKIYGGELSDNGTPPHAVSRFVGAYEQKNEGAYSGMFTGDFQYEFSTSTDPTLVQQYSAGWFKTDETASSTHLFNGYTPSGGATLPAATTININLAVNTPTDDNTSGADPSTHKVLATRVDGDITVPQQGSEPLTYVITNNYNVFYFVRGDSAHALAPSQPADSLHWYIYRWVDLSEALPTGSGSRVHTKASTWGSVKGAYR